MVLVKTWIIKYNTSQKEAPMKTLILLLAMVMLVSCVSRPWIRPYDKTEQDFQQDVAQCRYEAQVFTQSPGFQGYGTGRAIGYGIGSGMENGMRMVRLFNACMEARGYRRK